MAVLQVKDILYHLYMTARGNLQRLMPKDIRIVKYLLTMEDPEERLCALKDAFTPGEEIEGNDVDCLYTYVYEILMFSIDCVEIHAFINHNEKFNGLSIHSERFP